MAQLQYTAEVKSGLLLELPKEAENLHLQPGDKVQVQLNQGFRELIEIVPDNRKRISALGKYAFVPGGSDDFAKEKQIELQLEDREH